jgi:isoleucyl-tRNA synthetase
VHRIQNLRNDAGFEIADRIKTYYSGDATVAQVMQRFGDYVRQETLSVELSPDAPEHGVHSEDRPGGVLFKTVETPSKASV